MSTNVIGIIENYRRGPRSQKNNQMIIYLPNFSREEVSKLIGKSVIYTDKYGNKYEGYVKKQHGRNSKVLVEFKRPLPGISLGDFVEIKI